MLKVLHITETHSATAGGVTTVVNQLAENLIANGHETEIIASGNKAVQPPLGAKLFTSQLNRNGYYWLWSNKLLSFLKSRINTFNPDIIHLHGVWMAPHWYGAKLAYQQKIATILSPHGMLEPWLWDKQGLLPKIKKKMYWRVMAYPIFKQISAIHAITPLEHQNLSKLFPPARIEVIPNAIDSSDIKLPLEDDKEVLPIFFYIGRIHPIKGVDLLVNAFIKARLAKKWKLVIAGPDEVPTYTQKLKDVIRQECFEDWIEFIGPVYGMNKWKWLSRSWAVVVPSHSEVVGMVNLEAAACCTPTITTYQTGLWDWEEGGGILLHPEVKQLTEALRQVCAWSIEERKKRGNIMCKFIEARYSMKTVGKQWLALYNDLAIKGH